MPFAIQLKYNDGTTEWYKGGNYIVEGERYLIVGPYKKAKCYSTRNRAAAALTKLRNNKQGWANFYDGVVTFCEGPIVELKVKE